MSGDVSHFFFNPEAQALHMNKMQNAPLVQTKEDIRIAQLASKAVTALDNASLNSQADGVKSIIAESKSFPTKNLPNVEFAMRIYLIQLLNILFETNARAVFVALA